MSWYTAHSQVRRTEHYLDKWGLNIELYLGALFLASSSFFFPSSGWRINWVFAYNKLIIIFLLSIQTCSILSLLILSSLNFSIISFFSVSSFLLNSSSFSESLEELKYNNKSKTSYRADAKKSYPFYLVSFWLVVFLVLWFFVRFFLTIDSPLNTLYTQHVGIHLYDNWDWYEIQSESVMRNAIFYTLLIVSVFHGELR